MIDIGPKGIDIGNATFEVIPRNFNYARQNDKREATTWDIGVKDDQAIAQFRIEWEKEFDKFRLCQANGLNIYIILTEEWINKLRNLPENYMWVSDALMDMTAYPDGNVIDIDKIRNIAKEEVLASLQKFIDHDACYPDCDTCTAQDDW